MHGQARTVERKIRLWVVQQERTRSKERELAHGGVADGMRVQLLTPAGSVAKRK
jgi:hypothetical protein